MDYLFQCTIGPVQEFIATARRSRDLWYGSWMLSELSKAAAKAIADSGGRLIFPATADPSDLEPESRFNSPNKVVAVISIAPDDMAMVVEGAIRDRLYALRDGAFSEIKDHPRFNQGLANTQIDDLVELYWVGIQFGSDEGYDEGYRYARQQAEALLSARKSTREFSQVIGARTPKSSLDGARESVIAEAAYPSPGDSDVKKQEKAGVLLGRFKARPAERLSGVDILKRLGESRNETISFRSTSGVAALPFLKHVDSNSKVGDHSQLLDEIKDVLINRGVSLDETDGALVFSSRLAELVPDGDMVKSVVDDVETVLKKYAGTARPQPYYALLVADGDNMGAAIDHQTTLPNAEECHRELSMALSRYARKVGDIVEQHQGTLVYSGGDDIMAYLPLHTALNCAQQLAEGFANAMSRFQTANGVSPTLSTGIVVAHHLDPLSDTLDLARSAERVAKTVTGKHGLAITVSKRSGTDRTIKDKRVDLQARLERMIDWRRDGALAAGVAYELQELDRVLGQAGLPEAALSNEALRIVARKRESGGDKQLDKAVTEAFQQWIEVDRLQLQELALELIVASMFAAAIDLAKDAS